MELRCNVETIYNTIDHDLAGRVAVAGVLAEPKVNYATPFGIVRARNVERKLGEGWTALQLIRYFTAPSVLRRLGL